MQNKRLNAQYNVARPDSLALKFAFRLRRRMYEEFLRRTAVAPDDTILDVGVTSDTSYDVSNYLEAWYPHPHRITAAGVDDAGAIERRYPGVRFVRADGRRLPFADRSFDVVHSSAVLEHVGTRTSQAAFVSELVRVARKAAFFTTPNRWFPIEVHTLLPVIHWLPGGAFRSILRSLGHHDLAQVEHLNLLGSAEIRLLCRERGIDRFEIGSVRVFGWPSNLMLAVAR